MIRLNCQLPIWVGCLLLPLVAHTQSFIIDPGSIIVEETTSNWQTAILTGLVLSGNYGFTFYRIDLPPLEVGMPKHTGKGADKAWIPTRRAQRLIGWAADRTAYQCAQRFITNRAYYVNRAAVLSDFKRDMHRFLSAKVPGARVQYEGTSSPRIPRSPIRFLPVSFEAYLAHLGVGE